MIPKPTAFPPAAQPTAASPPGPRAQPKRAVVVGVLLVSLAFASPLYRLAVFALSSDLYSYILLIPFLSGYLLAQSPRHTVSAFAPPARRTAVVLLFLGGGVLGAYFVARHMAVDLSVEDRLALTTSSFVLILVGVVTWFVPRPFLAARLFPFGLLIFLVPAPSAVATAVETLMQHGSAAVARTLFRIFGTPVFYQQLNFQLPGINLHVAPECSGLRSTIALLIVSLVTGHFFLRSPWRRAALVLAVLPLALLRNGFRISAIGELCVRYGPHMIDSALHRRGGPIFFGLSLVPFFLFALALQRHERRRIAPLRPL